MTFKRLSVGRRKTRQKDLRQAGLFLLFPSLSLLWERDEEFNVLHSGETVKNNKGVFRRSSGQEEERPNGIDTRNAKEKAYVQKKRIPKWVTLLVLSISALLALILVGMYLINSTAADVDTQNREYLEEISTQKANVIKNMVQMELDKVETIANIIGGQQDFSVESAIKILETESERSSFKRIAFVPLDGNAIATDGAVFNVLDREYYQRALAGAANVSDRLQDKVDGESIYVYAAPVYHDNTLKGVLIAVTDTKEFSDILSTSEFGGESFSYIIKESGAPVVYTTHKNSFVEFSNLFDEMRQNGVEEQKIQQMQSDMQQGKSGFIEYSRGNVQRVAAFSKIGVNDWYVVSVVPQAVIFENTDRLAQRNLLSVVLTVIILGALIVLIAVQNQRNRRNLERLAYVDPVTGGNNLNKFKLLAAQELERHGGEGFYMLRIDIDNFKLINDMYGYVEGDDVLLNMDQAIAKTVSQEDIYGRIVNDNFLWLIKNESDDEIVKKGTAFYEEFNRRISKTGKGYTVNFTVGVYKVPQGETDIDKIIDRTAMAHRKAKLMPKDIKFAFYNERIRDDAVRIKTIENEMRSALANGEFEVYLQPKYGLQSGEMEGAEALVRWVKDGRVISPGEFIPVFEKNGFVVSLDLFMMQEVCRLQRSWLDEGLKPVPVSVNQSKPLVYDKDYVQKLSAIIQRYDLPPKLIEIELLETLIHENIEGLVKIISALHERGILICIDDFGSGYSSLNMLKDLHADVLKIDRMFLAEIENSERGRFLMSNIISLAKGLNMSVVAEGVETREQAEFLRELKCDTAQGFLYAKPMPAEEFKDRLKKKSEQ